jgi:hypothetical protein
MKTLINYILPIKRYSTWKDPNDRYIRVESKNWFNGFNIYPTVTFYYLSKNSNYDLIILDRYTFCKYMKKI